jgi:hypothetical protein
VKLRADLYAALALSALACGSPFEAPDDAACTPFGTETVLCPVESGTSTAPGTYCTYTTSGGFAFAATPVECQCKATYTCACLESTVTMPGELCPTGEVFFECDNSTGVPIVYCEIP